MKLSKISMFSMLSLIIVYSSGSQAGDGPMPSDMIGTDFPISACADKNRWAWYDNGGLPRYAECALHKNARGKVHKVKMWMNGGDLDITLTGGYDWWRSNKRPYRSASNLYDDTKSCDTRGKDWRNDTRLLSSRCIHAMMKDKASLEALYRLHGVRPSYKKRTGKNG
jgi:hypothetical protein